MHILLLGAGGFIGSELARRLQADGHRVTGLARDAQRAARANPALDWVAGDLRQMADPAAWAGLLDGMEVVVNAAGALQGGLRDDVGKVQYDAMIALYAAAQQAGVRRVVQISAAGAGVPGESDFMASKARADAALAASGLDHAILRPGLVIGRNCFGGTEMLRIAAAAPLARIDFAGTGAVQCVALADVAEATCRAVSGAGGAGGSFDLVEREARDLGAVIALHRAWLGLPPHRLHWRLPLALLRPVSALADLLGWLGWRSPLRSNAVAALAHGVTGNAAEGAALLGRDALSLPETLASMGAAGKADRWHARLAGLMPLALAALVALWLGSGLLGLLRTDAAAQVLVDGGMGDALARACVVGGSLADIAIAGGLLLRPALVPALRASLLLALAYCAGSLAFRADLWLDPLGPMLKVLPVIALTALCLAIAEER
ncbi:MAG: NAD(P)H-binding protein [Sphingomonadales bacterium]|nr:NAD(P)H-binding protein [Sphingomonadales bacterium]MBD3774209.1 NAD(P)H-binding protein [Paracoccaceae bacterium]